MSSRKEGAALVGVGAAACAVCCAASIGGFLAAIGLGTAVGVAGFGVIAAVLTTAVVLVVVRQRRRRRAIACQPTADAAVTIGRLPAATEPCSSSNDP